MADVAVNDAGKTLKLVAPFAHIAVFFSRSVESEQLFRTVDSSCRHSCSFPSLDPARCAPNAEFVFVDIASKCCKFATSAFKLGTEHQEREYKLMQRHSL